MKLFYFGHESDSQVDPLFSNFGDDLNATIWESLFPNTFDDDASTVLTGIGSFLNRAFAERFATAKKIVFGTGYGYGEPIGPVDDTWDIYFVRGPLTAASLGIEPSIAMADAAYLVRRLEVAQPERTTPVSVMPHCHSMDLAGEVWRLACDTLGYDLIDPREGVDYVMASIKRSQLLCTEALHGAVVADAVRTPWVPFVSNPTISALKWRDWCSAIGIEYRPVRLRTIWKSPLVPSIMQRVRRKIKNKLFVMSLQNLAKQRPEMSSDRSLVQIDDCLDKAIDQFRRNLGTYTALEVDNLRR